MAERARHRVRTPDSVSHAAVYYMLALVLCLFLLPAVVVLSGPLKSNGSPAVILALGAFAFVALAFVQGRSAAGTGGGPAALVVVAALELTSWATGYIRSTDPDIRAGVLRGLIGVFGYTGVGLLVALTMRSHRHRLAVVVVLVVGLSYDGIIGIIQGATSSDPRYLLRPPHFVLNRTFEPTLRDGYTRALGTSDSPIEYAVLMAALVALSLYLVRREFSMPIRLLGIVGCVVGLLGIPSSVSRTGVVGLAAVTLSYLIVCRLRDLAAAALGVAALIYAYALAVPSRSGQLLKLFTNASSDSSVTSRTSDYSVVYHEFLHHPIFGAGLGSTLPSDSRYLDNQWLQGAVEGGTVGIMALAILFVAMFNAAAGGIGAARSMLERAESIAYLAVVAAIFASSFTFDLFAFNQAKLLLFIVAGLAWGALDERRAVPPAGEHGWSPEPHGHRVLA